MLLFLTESQELEGSEKPNTLCRGGCSYFALHKLKLNHTWLNEKKIEDTLHLHRNWQLKVKVEILILLSK